MGKRDTIKVFLRVRPDKDGRREAPGYSVDHTFDDSKIHFHLDRRLKDDHGVNHSVEDYRFKFDRIFEPQTRQEEIFNMVAKDCVASALDGYNSTIFAYGQTGSGKTFSITGGTSHYDDRGIIPRSLSMIYDECAKRTDFQWSIKISYLQIYNDKGQDLLNHGEDARTLEDLPVVTVHETDDEIVMRGLEAHPASSVNDALQLLFLGDTNRLYCETSMNNNSSRSHCVFTVLIEARQHGSATVRTSKLNLVDLAGSERVAKTGVDGTLLQEAKYINISLHYLEHVIVALAEQSQGRREHVPFRNSMMTMALRDSLGGNCRTAMLATGHPGERFLMETVSTCKFASRVACIRQNARVNEVTDPAVLVKKLQKEIVQLKDKLAFLDKGDQKVDRELSADEMERCREIVTKYIEDSDPKAELAGVGGDLARLMACISIMKQMIVGKGGVPKGFALAGGGQQQAAAPGGSPGGGGGGPSSAEVQSLKDQVEKLTVSLQEKENELTLMFAIVEKHNAAKFNAMTQTNPEDLARTGSSHAARLPSGRGEAPTGGSSSAVAALAGGMRDRPPPVEQQSHPDLQADRERQQAFLQGAQLDAQQEELQNNYNLNALTDTELLKDRHLAFEAFRKSYRKHEQIEKNKVELKKMYERCEAQGTELRQIQEQSKWIKSKVQQLRTERALQCIEEPDQEEQQLMGQLNEARRVFQEKAKVLGKEKERVEHMHLVMNRAQEQLTKDFEEWFVLRQKQVALAQRGVGGAAAQQIMRQQQQQPTQQLPARSSPDFVPMPPEQTRGLPSSAPSSQVPPPQGHSGGGSSLPPLDGGASHHASPLPASAELRQRPQATAATQQQQPPNMLSGSIMGRLAAANGGAGDRTSPPPVGAPGASLPRGSSGVAFHEEQHRRIVEENREHNARMAQANPYAPSYKSTGNAAADAELAKMYQARDQLRQQLSGGAVPPR